LAAADGKAVRNHAYIEHEPFQASTYGMSELSTREISETGKSLVRQRLTELGYHVSDVPRGTIAHLGVSRSPDAPTKSLWVSTNLKPKPAGGGGPPSLNWQIRRTVQADLFALVDLSTNRIWVMKAREVVTTAQQHNPTYHHMIMVVKMGWTSPPHTRIRDDQFEHLLLERRIAELIGR
jgi:hypothetical protein